VQATNTILHECISWKPAILLLYSEMIQHRSATVALMTLDAWVRTSRFAKLNVKAGPHLAYIFFLSILLVFSKLLCFAFFRSFLDCFPVISFLYRIDIHI